MAVSMKTENGVPVLSLDGRITSTNASAVEQEALKTLAGYAGPALQLDLGALEYISSAGLRVLLSAHKAMSAKGGMKVSNVNEIVQEVFEVTGFADILNIER